MVHSEPAAVALNRMLAGWLARLIRPSFLSRALTCVEHMHREREREREREGERKSLCIHALTRQIRALALARHMPPERFLRRTRNLFPRTRARAYACVRCFLFFHSGFFPFWFAAWRIRVFWLVIIRFSNGRRLMRAESIVMRVRL